MQQSPARSEPSRFTPNAPGAYEHLPGIMKKEKRMIEHGVRVSVPFPAVIKFRWHSRKSTISPTGEPGARCRAFDQHACGQDSAPDKYGGAP